MLVIDAKLGVPAKWQKLQIAAYVELVQYGVDENGIPFMQRKNKTAFEVRLFHPIYNFAGTVDIIIDDGKPEITGHILYLRDNETYKLEVVNKLYQRKKEFLTLTSAYHIRRNYGI